MKGVRSDFIKTFKAKFSDENSYSIGFSFKYLDVPTKDQTVQVSLKIGNNEPLFYFGKDLSIEEFKEKFVKTIDKINNLTEKDYKKIVDVMKTDFELLPEVHLKDKKKLKP